MEEHRDQLYNQVNALVYLTKAGARAIPSYDMEGELYLSQSGWLLLKVPNALVRGAYDALNVPGLELPPSGPDGKLNAHVSIIKPDELEQIGGPDKITERGHRFKYRISNLKSVKPATWKEMSKVYFLEVVSPELQNLRKSYGLTPLLNGNEHPFHITCGVVRKSVTRDNDIVKGGSYLNIQDQIDPLYSYSQNPDWTEFDENLVKMSVSYLFEESPKNISTPLLITKCITEHFQTKKADIPLLEEDPRKKKKPSFPWLGLAGAGALAGTGAGTYYAGHKLDQFGNLSFPDLHEQLHKMRGGSINTNYRPWKSESLWKYNPEEVNKFEANYDKNYPDALPHVPQEKIKSLNVDWKPLNESVLRTMNAKDLLESQLHYLGTGANALGKPAYGNTSGLQVMQWMRHPQNQWWIQKIMGPEAKYWGKDTLLPTGERRLPTFENPRGIEYHYGEFAKGVGSGYEHLLKETSPSINSTITFLAQARQQALQDIVLGRIKPEEYQQHTAKLLTDKVLPAFHPDSAPLRSSPGQRNLLGIAGDAVAGVTNMPFVRSKATATFNNLIPMLEERLPPEQRFTPQLIEALKKQPVQNVADQEALVRTAFGYKDQDTLNNALRELFKKQQETLQKAGPLTPVQQADLLYKNLQKDPLAHLASTGGPVGGIHYPVAAPFYRALAEGMALPGRAAQTASSVSPWLRYGGLGMAGAGGAYGLYKLYNYLQSRSQPKKKEEPLEKKAWLSALLKSPWARRLLLGGGLAAGGYGTYRYGRNQLENNIIPEMRTRAQEEWLGAARRAVGEFAPEEESSGGGGGGSTDPVVQDPRLDPLRKDLRDTISKAREYQIAQAKAEANKQFSDLSTNKLNEVALGGLDTSIKNPLAWAGMAGLGATGGAMFGEKKKKIPSAVTGALTGLGMLGGATAARHFAPTSGLGGAAAGAGLGGLLGNIGGSALSS